MRLAIAAGLAIALSGCLNWQSTYDNAARDDCRRIVNTDERLACLSRVEENSRERRAESRG